MASRIHQLPDDLVARIAAGEVVERPASLLKELIENSLDAGATWIAVAIDGAGRTRIAVSDNGSGMTRTDALMAIKRHATSKIQSFDDLEAVSTYGFRGEALPSIAAVSRFAMTTRNAEEETGWELSIEGGTMVSERPVAREPGTTIEVRDIFFNTPARFKFLKSDGTERGQCLRVLEEMIFASVGVTFELTTDGGKPVVFRAHPSETTEERVEALRTRVVQAWGPRWGRGLLPVGSKNDHFSVAGLVTNQGGHQATARYQFLYVNGRPVQNRRLARAVYDAYTGQLPSLRHPGWVLFLNVDPRTVDVNVHPSKREVKLTHESELYGFLKAAIQTALRSTSETPVEFFRMTPERTAFDRTPQPVTREEVSLPSSTTASLPWGDGVRAAESTHAFYRPLETSAASSESLASLSSAAPIAPEVAELRDPSLTVVAQVRRTYLVAETANGVLLIDQHAAAERVGYERLMENARAQQPSTQMLLVPFVWETALSVAPLVANALPTLASFGFVIEPFGGESFVVKGVPSHVGEKVELASLLDGLSDVLADTTDGRAAAQRTLQHRLCAMTACKASVKAGDPLDLREARRVTADLSLCREPFTCPHGRPTVVRLPYSDLERRFRRA